jgi:ATP-dependent DNA helicase DinG
MADKLARMLGPVIEKTAVDAFFLCTSHSMMRELAERFRE